MIMINVTEWVVDFFILGLAVVVWGIGLFLFSLLFSLLIRYIKDVIQWLKRLRNITTRQS